MQGLKQFTARTHGSVLALTAALVCLGSTAQAQMTSEASGVPMPNAFFHSFAGFNSATCKSVAVAPTGKALVVTQVYLDIYANPAPGAGQQVIFYTGLANDCNGAVVRDLNAPGIGGFVVPFGPGLGIPAGTALNARVTGSIQAEAYTDGYTVSSKSVPPLADRRPGADKLPQQR
jgi:hypothetical protein